MATRRVSPPWDYLHEASAPSLESFELSRLNHAANLRKEIAALIDQWIDEVAQGLLARWLREDHRLAQRAASTMDLLPPADVPLSPSQPISVRPGESDRRARPPRRASSVQT